MARQKETHVAASPATKRRRLRSQAGPHAGAWLTAIPAEPATTLPPQAMQLALRRRLRLPLPRRLSRCGPSPGCGELVDHALACPRTGLLARRAKIVERAWVRVAREAVGADGQALRCDATLHGVAAHAHGSAPTLRCRARRRHAAGEANRLPGAQRGRSAAAPRPRLRSRWALE